VAQWGLLQRERIRFSKYPCGGHWTPTIHTFWLNFFQMLEKIFQANL